MKFLNSAKIKDNRVLLRLDLNVPLDEEGNITDDSRIKKSLPTLKYILKKKPKQIIITSHLGRPNGRIISKLKLTKVTRRLVATHINNGMKELRNKAKSPGLKKAFQKIIKTRDLYNQKISGPKNNKWTQKSL